MVYNSIMAHSVGDYMAQDNWQFQQDLDVVMQSISRMLISKNQAYGDSALNPVRIFSQADPIEQLKVRLDDKLSRIARGSEMGEDVINDLIGYLVIYKIHVGRQKAALLPPKNAVAQKRSLDDGWEDTRAICS